MKLTSPRMKALAEGRRPEKASDRVLEVLGAMQTAQRPDRPAGLECELCSAPIGERHRHMVDRSDHGLRCVCRACSVLFDRNDAGGDRFRLVPDEVRRLDGFDLPDELWNAFGIPVDLAFFFQDSEADRVVAFYPGPLGATESRLGLERWPDLIGRNPALRGIAPDVEALLVSRVRKMQGTWMVPVDVCYALVGVIREHWKGLAGGTDAWRRIQEFFEELSTRARPVRAADFPGFAS